MIYSGKCKSIFINCVVTESFTESFNFFPHVGKINGGYLTLKGSFKKQIFPLSLVPCFSFVSEH